MIEEPYQGPVVMLWDKLDALLLLLKWLKMANKFKMIESYSLTV